MQSVMHIRIIIYLFMDICYLFMNIRLFLVSNVITRIIYIGFI